MYISNKDLEILQEVELYLFRRNTSLYLKLYGINEKLLKNKEENNKKNWSRIAKKRQKDKNYARSKKEIAKRSE